MEKNETKINVLLRAQTAENNYLAYQLLQSLLRYTSLDALDSIFQFQLEQFWNPKMSHYSFELGNYKIHFSSKEEMETDYSIDFHYLTVYIDIYSKVEKKRILRKEVLVSDYIWEEEILIQEYIRDYKICIQRILPQFEELLSAT